MDGAEGFDHENKEYESGFDCSTCGYRFLEEFDTMFDCSCCRFSRLWDIVDSHAYLALDKAVLPSNISS
ncbi:unnamed protein product [Lactuca virosa]|uniref:Uncharacterized protein n=1 Tax=Lactuca virosa TaxID=75947 RepID=A0AAU9M2U1_9ASTR|nr:unnamed protein product [Lactuca virosa]